MQKNTNQLFETLLGEDASALVSKDPTKGDGESTQMSSILGPLRDKEEKKSFDNNTPKQQGGSNRKTGGMLDYNSNNNGMSNNNNRHHVTNQQQSSRRQSNEETLQTFPEDQTLGKHNLIVHNNMVTDHPLIWVLGFLICETKLCIITWHVV